MEKLELERVSMKKEYDNQSSSVGERLQKVIAQAGVASRRQAEEFMRQGRVKVNGVVVSTLGTKVRLDDKIEIDGKPLPKRQREYSYFLLHKPCGYITSASDPQGRKTVMDLFKKVPQRIYPVGRLDYNTSGLLLLTNDGEIAHRLMHPSYEVKKTYQVEVEKKIPEKHLQLLRKGIELEDGKTAPAQIREVSPRGRSLLPTYEITIHEGRNRQVRRMFLAIGFPVVALKRIRFGPLELESSLPSGQFRPLTHKEIQSLKDTVKPGKVKR